jgi:3-methylcrotonyl-CoA carboxylase beta subunit
MALLACPVDTASADFRDNAVRMRALVEELERRRAEAAIGGPARARERHTGRALP